MKDTYARYNLILDVFNAEGEHEEIATRFGVKRRWVGKIKDGSLRSSVTGVNKKIIEPKKENHTGTIRLLYNGHVVLKYEYRSKFRRIQKMKYWSKYYANKNAVGYYEIQISPNISEKELNITKLPPEKTKPTTPETYLKFINPKLLRFEKTPMPFNMMIAAPQKRP